MKALVLTNKGVEDISVCEIKDISKAEVIDVFEGVVELECSKGDLIKLTYMGRTFNRVIEILDIQDIKKISDIKLPDFSRFVGKNSKIRVDCVRWGVHEFNSFNVEVEVGRQITEKYEVVIDFKDPDVVVYLQIIRERCFVGVDYSGIDLGKRFYRVFLGAEALRGNVAATLLKLAEYESGEKIIDPFCRHGIIPIESALIATNTSVNKFIKDKLAFVKFSEIDLDKFDKKKKFKGEIVALDPNFKNIFSAKKNAKIAGVVKDVFFSRLELRWLDSKFKERDVDKIITLIPPRLNVYDQFFYQAEFILNKKGKIILCAIKDKEEITKAAEKYKFKLEKEHKIMQGEQELIVFIFRR